jgi:molybdopterin converting factor small subunit
MVTIRIPALWRSVVGAPQVEVEADDVEGALHALTARCPSLADCLFDAHGRPNKSLHLFVNREALRYHGDLSARLRDGDEVYIVPMISGGSIG